MPFDLGDVVPLAVYITDDNGNPADAGNVTLAVGLPDGTTTSPAVSHPATGTYSVAFPTTQAGHHTIRWVATGANASVYADVFDVFPADPRFLISLADAREALRKTPAATSDDNELRLYMAAVTPVVEDLAGPQAVTTGQLVTSGGGGSILLPSAVSAVTSVTENGVTLTQGTDYTVDLAAGIVYRGTQRQAFAFINGQDNIVINYTVGNGIIPENVRIAARIILKHLWQADNGGGGNRPALGSTAAGGGGPDVTVTPGGYAVPRRAAELLAPAIVDMPGFA